MPEQYKCAELARGDIEALSDGPPWSADAWGLGCLMMELFRGSKLTGPEQLRELAQVPKEVSGEYQRLLSQNPTRRLNPNKVWGSTLLCCRFCGPFLGKEQRVADHAPLTAILSPHSWCG